MFFRALTFAGARISCLNPRPSVILAFFFNDSIENIAENEIESVKTHLKPIEFLKRPLFCFLRNTEVIPRDLW